MHTYLQGLALQYYRGIGAEKQIMYPFGSFNIFVGANNSGKSTVINFINNHIPFDKKANFNDDNALNSTDKYRGPKSGRVSGEICIPKAKIIENIMSKRFSRAGEDEISSSCGQVLEYITSDGMIWLSPDVRSRSKFHFVDSLKESAVELIGVWKRLHYVFHGLSNSSAEQRYSDVLQFLENQLSVMLPKTHLVPAIREIGPKGQVFEDLSGRGLIDRLAEIQNPGHEDRDDLLKFDKINAFLENVTEKAGAKVEIPYNREHILVHMDAKVLPLEALGTGIHETIMIAAFCTLNEEQIICIEEPETHLHPIMQRKLINYLKTNTQNQYFITTHSASFIDTEGANVFHVANDGVQTSVKNVISNNGRREVIEDLGYKASDLVQTNAIIWVEGPSDRIYINHWIEAVNAELKEGIHYSILFYGGRTLSHLSADSEEVTNFIELRKINQYLAVVFDSDKSNPRAKINETKQRIRDELESSGSICWITKGREIENYIEHSLLQSKVKVAHPYIYKEQSAGGQFDHALYFKRNITKKYKDGIHIDADKVKIAKLVCEEKADLSILDLEARIEALIEMIKSANSMV